MTSSCTATYAALIFSVLVFGLVIRKRFYPVYFDTTKPPPPIGLYYQLWWSWTKYDENQCVIHIQIMWQEATPTLQGTRNRSTIFSKFFHPFGPDHESCWILWFCFLFYRIHVWGRNNKYFPMLLDPKIRSHVLSQLHVRSYIGWLRWGDVKWIPTPFIVLYRGIWCLVY